MFDGKLHPAAKLNPKSSSYGWCKGPGIRVATFPIGFIRVISKVLQAIFDFRFLSTGVD